MPVSVVIPSYNTPAADLLRLAVALNSQTARDFEVLLVDDGSDERHYAILSERTDFPLRLIRCDVNRGPAAARNVGVAAARYDRIFFTDADCEPAVQTIAEVDRLLEREWVVAGETRTVARSFFGRAVAMLGFPGGGALGFSRVWKVSDDGTVASLSTCNAAMRRDAFVRAGGFDESIPVPGGEDTVLADRLLRLGCAIRFNPAQEVVHGERSSWASFVAWQKTRGRGAYHILKRIGRQRLIRYLRPSALWSMLTRSGAAAPLVLFLFLSCLVLQARGYLLERRLARVRA